MISNAVNWVQLHSFALLLILSGAVAAVPVAANIAIPILRKRGYDNAARWVAAKAPLVLKALHFAEDVIANPTQVLDLSDAAKQLETTPTPASAARMIVTVRSITGDK